MAEKYSDCVEWALGIFEAGKGGDPFGEFVPERGTLIWSSLAFVCKGDPFGGWEGCEGSIGLAKSLKNIRSMSRYADNQERKITVRYCSVVEWLKESFDHSVELLLPNLLVRSIIL